MRISAALILSLATLLWASCKDAKKAKPAQEDARVSQAQIEQGAAKEPPEPALPPTRKAKMQGHFVHAISAKDTVLFGDIDVAMDSFRWLAENGASEDIEEPWEPHVGRIRRIAGDTVGKKSIEVMAMAVAQLARECGSCHAALGAEPKIPVVKNPPGGQEFRDHMIGHKWALDRMWAGLTTPSNELWLGGANYLASQPTHLHNLSSYGKNADMAVTYAARVHKLAEDAIEETQSDRRMAIFGRFLAACAGCHSFPASTP